MGKSAFGVAPPGIYSITTFADYRQVLMNLLPGPALGAPSGWMRQGLWLVTICKSASLQGYAPATLKKERAALRKIFDDRELAADVILPVLSLQKHEGPGYRWRMIGTSALAGIGKKSRSPGRRVCAGRSWPTSDRGHVFEIRRMALAVWVPRGKGSRPRVSRVRADLQDQFQEVIEDRDPEQPVFDHIHKAMDVHACRYEYSVARQEEENEKDRQRGVQRPRKEKLREVSEGSGHNRIGVIITSYGGHRRR